jgi:hypothetical protein
LLITIAEGDVLSAAEIPPEQVQAAEPVEPEGYFGKEVTSFGKTLDLTHELLEQDILKQAIRLDDFFGKTETGNFRPTSYELHWRNALRAVDDGKDLKYGTSLRASLVLSKINDRLHLSITGEDVADPNTPSLPEDPGNPGFDRITRPSTGIINSELRYTLIKAPNLDSFLGAGARISIPFEAFVRSRIQYTHPFNNLFLIRFGETFFLKSDKLLGETTEISLERLLRPKTILLWANAATASQEIEGLEWGSELSLLHEISPKSAVTFTGGIYGNNNYSPLVQNFRLLALYRRNFLRKWLFYELEPEVTWAINTTGGYTNNFAITIRLEIAFQGTGKNKLATQAPEIKKP